MFLVQGSHRRKHHGQSRVRQQTDISLLGKPTWVSDDAESHEAVLDLC